MPDSNGQPGKRERSLTGFYCAMAVAAALLAAGAWLFEPVKKSVVTRYAIYKLRNATSEKSEGFSEWFETVYEAAKRGDRTAMDAMLSQWGKLWGGMLDPMCTWPAHSRTAYLEQLDRWPDEVVLGSLGSFADEIGDSYRPGLARDEDIDGYRYDKGQHGPRGLTMNLEPLAEQAQNPEVRERAGELLAFVRRRFARELSEESSIRALSDSDPLVRRETLKWLCYAHAKDTSMAGTLCKALEDPDVVVQRTAAHALSDSKWKDFPEFVPALMKAIADEDKRGGLIGEGDAMCEALGALGAVDSLTELLDNNRRRHAAMEALAAIGPGAKAAEARLRKLLADTKEPCRLEAAYALWRISGDADAVLPTLTQALKEQPCGSARVIARIGPPAKAAVPFLAQALDNQDKEARSAAAEALGKIGPEAKAVIPALERLLEDGRPEVRCSAAEALGSIDTEGASVEALVKTLGDREEIVRVSAARALGEIGPAARVAAPDLERTASGGTWWVTRWAVKALGRIGAPRSVEPVCRLLHHEDKYVRVAACNALGDIGDPRAQESIEALMSDEKEWVVRAAAAAALKRLRERR